MTIEFEITQTLRCRLFASVPDTGTLRNATESDLRAAGWVPRDDSALALSIAETAAAVIERDAARAELAKVTAARDGMRPIVEYVSDAQLGTPYRIADEQLRSWCNASSLHAVEDVANVRAIARDLLATRAALVTAESRALPLDDEKGVG